MKQNYSMRPFGEIYDGLYELANSLPDIKTMVEIGSYAGESTIIFAKKVLKLYAVDPWMNGYDEGDLASHIQPMNEVEELFDFRVKDFTNVEKIKMKSVDAALMFPDKSLDFVYIDGLHTYDGVRTDLLTWLPKVKTGGFIGGHDYREFDNPDVKKAVDEIIKVDKVFRDSSYIARVL